MQAGVGKAGNSGRVYVEVNESASSLEGIEDIQAHPIIFVLTITIIVGHACSPPQAAPLRARFVPPLTHAFAGNSRNTPLGERKNASSRQARTRRGAAARILCRRCVSPMGLETQAEHQNGHSTGAILAHACPSSTPLSKSAAPVRDASHDKGAAIAPAGGCTRIDTDRRLSEIRPDFIEWRPPGARGLLKEGENERRRRMYEQRNYT